MSLFAYASSELFTAGALLPMHEDLGVSTDSIGSLVTTYAVVAAATLLPAAALIVQFQAFVTEDSPGWSRLASSFYVLAFQIGIAAGGLLGGRAITGEGGHVAALSTALAIAGAALTAYILRRHSSGNLA